MECDICCEKYNSTNHRPLFLPCQHTLCKACLLHINKKVCPTCKQAFREDVAALPTNLLVMRLAVDDHAGVQEDDKTLELKPLCAKTPQGEAVVCEVSLTAAVNEESTCCTSAVSCNSHAGECSSSLLDASVCVLVEGCAADGTYIPPTCEPSDAPDARVLAPELDAPSGFAIEGEPVRPYRDVSSCWSAYVPLLALRCANMVCDLRAIAELGHAPDENTRRFSLVLLASIFISWSATTCVLLARGSTSFFPSFNTEGILSLLAATPVVGPFLEGFTATVSSEKAWRRMYWSLIFQGMLQALPGVYIYMAVIPGNEGHFRQMIKYGLAAATGMSVPAIFALGFTLLLVCFG